MPDEDWLTIAAAAKELGIAERQARRYAAKLADSDRTLDRTDGQRDRTLVRLSALRSMTEAVRTRSQASDNAPDTDRTLDRTLSAPSATLSVAYERIIGEKDSRIAELTAALEHERRQTVRLTDALTREQQLRLLASPPPEPEPPADTDTSPDTAQAAPKKNIGFWGRLFGRKEDGSEANSENSG